MKFSNTYFTIDVTFREKSVVLKMQVDEQFYHTRLFEDVVPFLDSHVPDVLETKCFNPGHLSFEEEVVNTEFGHLFEHILITLLCDEAINAGETSVRYRANTAWNWKKNPRGTFEITINAKVDPKLFAAALEKTAAFATDMCSHNHKNSTAVAFATAA